MTFRFQLSRGFGTLGLAIFYLVAPAAQAQPEDGLDDERTFDGGVGVDPGPAAPARPLRGAPASEKDPGKYKANTLLRTPRVYPL